MNGAHKRTKVVIACAIFLGYCSAVFALNPSLDVSQYAHKSWKVREGFFSGSINTIEQTPDGYLWIGTDFGLYRFDGVRSVPWQTRRNESLPSNIIRKLFVSQEGTLWIGTAKGLASWKDGKLTLYPDLPAEGVDAVAEDGERTVWVGLEDIPAWRLCSITKGAVQCFGDRGTLGLGKGSLLNDRNGNIWAGTGTGLWRWRPGSPQAISLSGPDSEVHALIEDDRGAVLVSTRGGLLEVLDGNTTSYRLSDYDQPFNPFSLLRDRDGGLWIGTKDRGLLHLHQGRTDHFGKSDGLSSDFIADLFEDREGNIWVGTSGGLDSFHEFAISTMADSHGFSTASVESVLTASDGSVWLGTRTGLDRWEDRRLSLYRKRRAPLPPTVRQIIDPGLPDDFQSSIYEDHRGRIWVFSREGAAYLDERSRFIRVPDLPGGFAHSIAEDSEGGLWISQDQGFFHLPRGGKVEQIPWAKLGVRGLALALAGDPTSRGLWLGFSQGGVAYFKDGRVRQWYAASEGLGGGRVNKLQVDQGGTLWAGTEGGLSRLSRGRVSTLTSQNGLPCNSVHDFVRDNAQSMWLHTGCGLVAIAHSDLEAWISDPKRAIKVTVFDTYDGLTPVAIPGGLSPRMGKSTDGKIWFVSGDGVSVIDPRHLPFNGIPPPVYIEQITADGKVYTRPGGSGWLRLPPLVHNLTIDYAGLSLAAPERVHFRFKLEGQDKDWREVVNQRRVEYSNLPPMNYRFRLIACNNSGVWNEKGAVLDFSVAPAYYQTNWFRALGAVILLALLWAAYQFRVRHLQRESKQLRDVIDTIPGYVWSARPDGSVDFINRRWLDFSGMSLEDGRGRGWEAAVHPDDLARFNDEWRAAVESGKTMETEARVRRADGQYRWLLIRNVPLHDEGGRIVKWYGTSTDIEDRKRAEQLQADLAHTNRVSTLGELTASLAHEIQQPIAGAVTNASACLRWLKHDQPNLHEVRQAAERIVRDGRRAGEIIDALRTFYRRSPPKQELVEVNEIIREMLILLRIEANRYSIAVRTDLAADLPKITADRVQLQQVLMNLMLNAVQAMEHTGGELTVKSQFSQNHELLISVSDTGAGLPTGKADQIFNAFFTTKPQGTGMGLAISRTIVESYGGRIWATANEGRGTTFHFTLPAAKCEADVSANAM